MPRPGLQIGHHGEITTKKQPNGQWRSRCRYKTSYKKVEEADIRLWIGGRG